MPTLIDNRTHSKLKYYLPNNDVLSELSDLFSVLSDSTRVKILSAICITEMCVGDIAEVLNLNQTTVSHQLKILKGMGVVAMRRDGKTIYYSLASMLIPEIMKSGALYLGY
ncbi:MAG: metalloregulator ArsR/SmtB family transcription factor [Clostridia bacterium]